MVDLRDIIAEEHWGCVHVDEFLMPSTDRTLIEMQIYVHDSHVKFIKQAYYHLLKRDLDIQLGVGGFYGYIAIYALKSNEFKTLYKSSKAWLTLGK